MVPFHPDKQYDLIVSISTLEHVGWEGPHREPGKGLEAFRNLVSLLAPGGVIVLTIPVWLNGLAPFPLTP